MTADYMDTGLTLEPSCYDVQVNCMCSGKAVITSPTTRALSNFAHLVILILVVGDNAQILGNNAADTKKYLSRYARNKANFRQHKEV